MSNRVANYTAIIQQQGDWWMGWVEEVAGVNSQARSREELLENLRDALEEALEMNRADVTPKTPAASQNGRISRLPLELRSRRD